ncbi:MAG TPA: Clp protease N-terminal domain-containing protein [Jatrophihabitans sp.]|nr:Clp protease N-terminal domain-containing protein [Jatrophihabitans sp.]
MPKINVYLPDDLANAVREAGIPVSAVCQRALADAVAAADGAPGATRDRAGEPRQGWQPNRFTDRARRVFELAAEVAGSQDAATSIHLVEALIEQGNNLALAVLRSLDIEPADLLAELRATVAAMRRTGGPDAAGLREVGERAARAADDLGTAFVGCEHVLLGILTGPADDPARSTLNTLGLDLAAATQAVRAALNGYSYAQGNLSLSGLSAPVRSILEEIRQRLGRLEAD